MTTPLVPPTEASADALAYTAPLPRFGDSGETPQQIPYDLAALYSVDCAFPVNKWYPDYADRWDSAHRHWYTQQGSHQCQLVDYQPDTPIYTQPDKLRAWVLARKRQPPQLGNRSIIYCDRADARAAWHITEGLEVHWLIATLDGILRTPQELARELNQIWRAPIAAEFIWGQQVTDHGTYDENILFGTW